MELTEKQLKTIYELVSKGVESRNKILDKVIEDDEDLKKVTLLYKKHKDRIEIAKELKTDIGTAQAKIDLVDFINKKIDSILSQKHAKECARNKSDKYRNSAQKMHANTRKNLYHKQIKEFLDRYADAKKNGNLAKMNLEKNIEKFEIKVNYLPERVSYKLYLAEMYIKIGNLKKARSILSWYDKEELTPVEKHHYGDVEKEIIIEENRQSIKKWCSQGKDYQEILKECERMSTGNRVLVNTKFIKAVINEYNNEKIEEDKER